MIDLDALERLDAATARSMPNDNHQVTLPLADVAALVRVARAAQGMTAYPFADFGRSEFEALEAALKPFEAEGS